MARGRRATAAPAPRPPAPSVTLTNAQFNALITQTMTAAMAAAGNAHIPQNVGAGGVQLAVGGDYGGFFEM